MKNIIIALCLFAGIAGVASAQTVYLRPLGDSKNCLVKGTNGGTPDQIECYSAVPFSAGDRLVCANLSGDRAPNRDDLKVKTVNNPVGGPYTFTVTDQSGVDIAGSGTWNNGDFTGGPNLIEGTAQICGKVQPYTLKQRPYLWTDPTGRTGIEMAAKISNGLLTNIVVNSSHIPTVNYAVSIAGMGIHPCTACFGIYGSATSGLNTSYGATGYDITAVGTNSITLSATTAPPKTYNDAALTASAWAYTGNPWWAAITSSLWDGRWGDAYSGNPSNPYLFRGVYYALETMAVRCYINELDTGACTGALWGINNFEFATSNGSFAYQEGIPKASDQRIIDYGTRTGAYVARAYELMNALGKINSTDKTRFINKALNSVLPAGETCTKPTPVAGTGTISVDKSTEIITGTGTAFLSELHDGDVLNTEIGRCDGGACGDQQCVVYDMAHATNTSAKCHIGGEIGAPSGHFAIDPPWTAGQCGLQNYIAHNGTNWPGQPATFPPVGSYNSGGFFTNQIYARVGGMFNLGLALCPDDHRGCYLAESIQQFYTDYMFPSEASLTTGTLGFGPNYDPSIGWWSWNLFPIVMQNAVVSGPDWIGSDAFKHLGTWLRYNQIPGTPAPIDSALSFAKTYELNYGGNGQPANGLDPTADQFDFGQSFATYLSLCPGCADQGKFQYWLNHDWRFGNFSDINNAGLAAGLSFETAIPTVPEINYHSTDPFGMLFTPTTQQFNTCLAQGTQAWQFPCTRNFSYNKVISKTGTDLSATSHDTLVGFSGEAFSVERSGPRYGEIYLWKGDELLGSTDTAVGSAGGKTELTSTNGTSNPCQVHSPGYVFSSLNVGNQFQIQPGPNWTPGWHTVIGLAGGDALIDAPCGTSANLSAGTWVAKISLRGQRGNRNAGDLGNARFNQWQLGKWANQDQDSQAYMTFSHGVTTAVLSYGFNTPTFDRFNTSDASGHVFTYAHLDCTTCYKPGNINKLMRDMVDAKNGAQTVVSYTYIDATPKPTQIIGDIWNYQQSGESLEGNTICPGGCASLSTNNEIVSLSTVSGVHSKFVPVGNSMMFAEYPADPTLFTADAATSDGDKFYSDGTRGGLFNLDNSACVGPNTCWPVSGAGNTSPLPVARIILRGCCYKDVTVGQYGVDTGKAFYYTQGSTLIHQDPVVGQPIRNSISASDLSTTNGTSNPCTVRSASYNFTDDDINGFVSITSGPTGWDLRDHAVISTSGGAAVLKDACSKTTDTLSGATWSMPRDMLVFKYGILSKGYGSSNSAFHIAGCAGSGGVCDQAATKYEMISVHKPFWGTTDPGLNVTAINPDVNWTGVQTDDKVVLFARGGVTHGMISDFSTTHSGTAQYFVGGLSAGTYPVKVNGTPVAGSPFTVASDTQSLEFSSTSGTVSFGGSALACQIISASPLPGGTIGSFYNQTIATSNCVGPVAWSVISGSLCTGLSLGAATGAITGTPLTGGQICNFGVQAIDSATPTPTTVTASYQITIANGGGGPAIHHILVDGQSLSQGVFGQYGDANATLTGPLSTTQPYSNLQLGNGCNWNGTLCSYASGAGFSPLIEGTNPTTGVVGTLQSVETYASGMANTLTNLAGGSFVSLVSRHGWTNSAYDLLNRQPPSPTLPITGTLYYQSLVDAMNTAKTTAAGLSRAYSVDAFVVTHGENDLILNHMPAATYVNRLLQWQTDVSFDRNRITGQTGTIPMFIDQMDSWADAFIATPTTDGSSNPDNDSTPIAQWIAARDNPNTVFLSAPKYGNLTQYYFDGVHFFNAGYRLLGGYHAKALKKVLVDGLPWKPLSPRSITISSNIITARLWVPAGVLTMDTTTLPAYTSCVMVADPESYPEPVSCRAAGGVWKVNGLEFYDSTNSAYITSVAVASGDTLTITLNTTPTGGNQRLRSAYSSRTGTADPWHNWSVGTNIRDTDTTVDDSGSHLYDWLITFDEPMGFYWDPTGASSGTLTAAPGLLSFGCTAGGGDPASQNIAVGESGGSLDQFTVAKTQSWLSLSPTSGVAAGNVAVSVTGCAGLSAGTLNDTVTISSNTAGITGTPITVPITLVVTAPVTDSRISGNITASGNVVIH